MLTEDGVADAAGVGVAAGVGATVAVAVAVAVGAGVGVVHGPARTRIVSTCHPKALTLLSEAIRNRSLIVCPLTFGPRFASVVM
jgi:hypothetical protein